MRTKLIALLLAMSLCGFWGCARSKSIDTAADGTLPAIDQNLEEAPAPSSAIADNLEQAPAAPAVDQNRREAPVPGSAIAHKLGRTPAVAQHKPEQAPAAPVVDQNRREAPLPSSATADKFGPNPTSTPRVKANDADVLPETAAKNGNTEDKPAEMKVANAFDRNPYLSSRVKPLLPSRTTMMDAATGFKNQRQFIAAVHLSKNLRIPFDQIKTRMTGQHHMSLNDSLRDLRPEMTKSLVKEEVTKAEKQAKEDENQAKDEAKKAAAAN